jgi:hypothetical protein
MPCPYRIPVRTRHCRVLMGVEKLAKVLGQKPGFLGADVE